MKWMLLTASTEVLAVQEISKFSAFLDEHMSDLISFALKVVLAIVVFIIGGRLIKWTRRIVKTSLNRANADKGVEQFVDSLLKFFLYSVLITTIAIRFGVEPASVAALLGTAGVAIGLALQGSLSNLAGGVLILLLRPFVVGDYIIEDSNKNEGTVKEIQIFYTKLHTIDNKIIVIPNGTLANNSLTNITSQDFRRLDLSVSISYEADLLKAKKVLEDLVMSTPTIVKDKDIMVIVEELGAHAVHIGCRSWVKTEDYWTTRWSLLENIKLKLDEEKIEIPYNQLKVHLNDLQN